MKLLKIFIGCGLCGTTLIGCWKPQTRIEVATSDIPVDEIALKHIVKDVPRTFQHLGYRDIDLGMIKTSRVKDLVHYEGVARVNHVRFGVGYSPNKNSTYFIDFLLNEPLHLSYRGAIQLAGSPMKNHANSKEVVVAMVQQPIEVLSRVPSEDDPLESAWKNIPTYGNLALFSGIDLSEPKKGDLYERRMLVLQVLALKVLLAEGRTKDALNLLPNKWPATRPKDKWEGRRYDLFVELQQTLKALPYDELVLEWGCLNRYFNRGGRSDDDPFPHSSGFNLDNT